MPDALRTVLTVAAAWVTVSLAVGVLWIGTWIVCRVGRRQGAGRRT